MHFVMLKWKRYCSPGSSGRSGMSAGAAIVAGANGLPRSASVMRTSVSLPPSWARSCNGKDIVRTSSGCHDIYWGLVNVTVVAVLVFQSIDIFLGCVGVHTALLFNDGMQSCVHILRHT